MTASRRKKTKRKSTSALFDRDVLRTIPGYDPFKTAGEGEWFDDAEAFGAVGFIEDCLTHVKGKLAGKPLILEPWQKAVVGNLFGWKRVDGTRRYRESFVFVPRKNGKSILAAAVGNAVLFRDCEPGAEIYCAAAERDQAALVFDMAKRMVQTQPTLSRTANVYRRAITIESQGSSFKPISADAGTKHGFNSHCIIIDELHAQENRELVDVLLTSTGARAQPLTVYITTSDYDRESICNEKYDYACQVRDGVIEDSAFLPVIYEAKNGDDITDERVWEKANPNLDVSFSREFLARECKKALTTPMFENTFKRLYLNIKTEQQDRWLTLHAWDACDDKLDLQKLKGKPCYAGLDLSATTDMSAFVLVFPIDGKYHIVPYFWIPKPRLQERRAQLAIAYSNWMTKEHLIGTDGQTVDYGQIRAKINKLGKIYKIKEIAIDRWNAIQLATELKEQDGFEVVLFGQGYASMSGPAKEFEKAVVGKEIVHGGHPVLRWMASNVAVQQDAAGNIKPVRPLNANLKIDGIVAAIMAIGRVMMNTLKPSSYERRGIVQL